MKLDNLSSTCFCSTYSSMTIKYTTMLNEYISANQKLKKEIETLKADIQNALSEYYPSGSTQTEAIPINYADFGFKSGETLQNIANYARQQNNPFFMPYAPEDVKPEPEPYRAPTIMPVSSNPQVAQPLRYAPSQDARGPAPRDIAPASVATSGSFRPAETGSTTARTAATPPPGSFKPVNIRTGGLASLRRK